MLGTQRGESDWIVLEALSKAKLCSSPNKLCVCIRGKSCCARGEDGEEIDVVSLCFDEGGWWSIKEVVNRKQIFGVGSFVAIVVAS